MTAPIDPVYNDPPEIEIRGYRFRVREVPARMLRQHIRAIVGLVSEIRAKHPELATMGRDGDAEGGSPGAVIIATLVGELDVLLDRATAIVTELVSVSSGLDEAAQGELPASVYFDLVGLVLEAQQAGIDSFLRLQGKVAGLVSRAKPQTRTSATRSPSPHSLEADSPLPTL
jgi:hypothetical protein